MSEPLHVHFEDLDTGQVLQLGAVAVDEAGLDVFAARFAPGWDTAYGAPDAMIYALWSRLASEKAAGWAQTKMLAVDGLRFMRNPPVGELLRGRMTVMGKDPVGDDKGIVIAQHDLLDEGGRLVFSCLTRAVFSRR
jgi:acyl dehydratase